MNLLRVREGGYYDLDQVKSENDKDGYTWIEARGPDNPPRLRYYKIMMFASDRLNPKLVGGTKKDGSYMPGYDEWPNGWGWFHNRGPGDTSLAADFNYHGLHIDPQRSNTNSEFWNTPGRVASETWFPPIKQQTNATENTNSGSGTMTTFLTKYAVQQAFYPNKDRNIGVDTPDIYDPNLEFSLVSSEDMDAAMMASEDAELDAEMLAASMKDRQAKMLNAMTDAFPSDPLDRLRALFLYDNLLTIHIGGSNDGKGKGGLNGAVVNKWLSDSKTKPSFYKTITKVTPDHDEVMTNFITDVKERTIYICSNVLLGISFCFLPYLKFPSLDVLVHSLSYQSNNNRPTYVLSQMPLTSSFAALFFALQTSLITSLKTNAAPLCAIIGLAIITMTLPTIHFKPGSRAKSTLRSNFEGLAFVNLCYMVLSLYPTMAPNKTIEQALYSLFFPPGAKFDKVMERMLPLLFMIGLQLFLSTDFLVFNIWFICIVPAICLLLFPLFRTFARYVGGDAGVQAAGMIDKISNQLVEDSVNTADSDTGLSMMDLVTKIILVLAVFFIFAEFFDAVNDHFGLSNLITQMVNSFRSITELIPEILLVFFIVMTFSKAIKSTTEFNKVAGPTAVWDSDEKQKLADGKNPAWAMVEYFLGGIGDLGLLILGGLKGDNSDYKSIKEKQAAENEKQVDKEISVLNNQNEIAIKKIELEGDKEKVKIQKEIQALVYKAKADELAAKKADLARIVKDESEKREKMSTNQKLRYEAEQRKENTRHKYELERLKLQAKNNKDNLEDQIKYAMFLNAGSNIGVNPIQIAQMAKQDASFMNNLQNAIATGQPLDSIVRTQKDKITLEQQENQEKLMGKTMDKERGLLQKISEDEKNKLLGIDPVAKRTSEPAPQPVPAGMAEA